MSPQTVYRFGSFVVHPASRTVTDGAAAVAIPSRVFDLLLNLVRTPAAASDQGRIADRRLGGRNHAIELDSDFAVARLSLNAQSYMAQYSPAIDAAIL
jgi:DNA-binding response OmpR family regulator